jgi:hypothetical protein
MSYRFADSLGKMSANSENSWWLLKPWGSCQQTCMTYTIVVCTVKNSWWLLTAWGSCQQTCMTCNFAVFTVKNSWWLLTAYGNCHQTSMTYHCCVYSEKLLMISDSLGKLSANLYDIAVCRVKNSLWLLTAWGSCQQTCMTYTIAVCTVKNFWWWTEELSETCRVSFQE